jgi:5-methyltetrahydropteroyltriglutamate--homocysteine methyltransferase
MKLSDSRILTTHVGSLPRSDALLKMLLTMEGGGTVEREAFRAQVAGDMVDILRHQADSGIDIAGDGELPRIGFSFYVKDRMSGFGGEAQRGTVTDFAKFPGYAALKMAALRGASNEEGDVTATASLYRMPEAQQAIRYDDTLAAAKEEMTLFADGLAECGAADRFAETFVTAAAPGIISTTLLRAAGNSAYETDRDYLLALAAELKKEYDYIVAQGHILQIDAPDLAMERQIMFVDRPLDAFLERAALHVEVLNLALADIPPEKVRLHVCWGNWDGPHLDDVELAPLLPVLYEARVGALSIAFANPRHQHEWQEFRTHRLPDHMALIPGVIDVTTNYLEHPQVVADRICQFVDVIGDRERVIAGCDCGFSTFAGWVMVPADVAWKKMEMLTEGARIASERLW